MKKIKKYYKNLNLFQKITSVVVIILVITYLFTMAGFQLAFYVYDRQLYGKSQQELDFFIQGIGRDLEDIEQLSVKVATDEQIQNQMRQMYEKDYLSYEFTYEGEVLRGKLQNMLFSEENVTNLIYTDGNQVDMTMGMYTGGISKETRNEILKDYKKVIGGYVRYSPTKEYPYLLCGRDVRDTKNSTLNYLGSLIFTVDINKMLEKKVGELQAEHSQLFVYSGDTEIYGDGEKNPDIKKLNGTQGYKIINYQGEKCFLCYQKSDDTGWMYVNLFPYSEIFGKLAVLRSGLLIGFIGVFLLASFMVQKIVKTITSPLAKLSDTMKIAENGDFETAKGMLKIEDRQDEVGVLSNEFRVMLEKIETLIHENYEKQLLIRDTKYKMLQAQINPHFLYNTLNAINWMIRAGENKDTSKMVMELGKLLRASFAKDPITSVKEEVETLRSYTIIQKFRYKERVEFVIEESGNLEQYQMPRMILQPLVENAINYGVELMVTKCLIKVQVLEKENEIYLSVYNDGPGMDEKRLEEVRAGTAVPQGHGIGLKNIRERIQMFFENGELKIESETGEGTFITIRIPKMKRESGNV